MCDFAQDMDVCPVWNETPRTARKAHECDGCGAAIQPGEAYLTHSHVFDGSAASEKMCFACWWVREPFGMAHRMTPTPSALIEQLRACVAEEGGSDWRAELASVLARYRTSMGRRRRLALRWMKAEATHVS